MNFNRHYDLIGKHAFLSASGYSWLRYDEAKLSSVYLNSLAKQRGTELHDLAKRLIELKVKLPKSRQTLNMFVNDAIGFQMSPEQPLYFSENCFGTADAISFKKNILRISDLKTGESPASMDQLKIYAALFCLEYGYDPKAIQIELRIYQSDDIFMEEPDPEEISFIMNKIIDFDKILNKIKEAGW